MHRVCPACQRAFVARKTSQRYCSAECRQAHHAELYRRHNPLPSDHAPSAAGAIAEAVVCVDLLRRGYHVYRSMVPGSGPDLALLRGRRLLLVEVTTGFRTSAGTLAPSGRKRHELGRAYDLLAIVTGDGVVYEPRLEIDHATRSRDDLNNGNVHTKPEA